MRRVVVTGLGAVSPIGCTPEEIWHALTSCRSGITALHIDTAPSFPLKYAGQVHNFSPTAFGISSKSLKVMNKTIQYGLAASVCAVKDAGIDSGVYTPEEVGIYLGVNGIQYTAEELFLASYEAVGRDMRNYMNREYRTVGEPVTFSDPEAAVHPLWPLSVLANMTLCHIAIKHNFRGNNLAFSSIDVSGSLAIGQAYKAISQGEADVLLAGGCYGLNTLDLLSLLWCRVLAEGEAVCLPFDQRRSGCVPGEGAALLVLEELERARKRGARIYAEVAGFSSWCDTSVPPFEQSKDTSAHLPLRRCIEQALHDASCDPDAMSCVYADGKSTVEGDRREVCVYEEIFGDGCEAVPITSATPLTGYMFSASGAFGALGAVLSLTHGEVPPLANLETPDEGCRLFFPKKSLKKHMVYAMANTFGFSGEHTSLIFQRYPTP